MNKLYSLLLLFTFTTSVISAQSSPPVITYAGKVNKNGVPYSGNGQFKFAFVNAAANVSYWSHDGTSTYGAAPTGYVTLPVNGGYYSILLGNTSISGMSAIDPAIFSTHSDVHLRVWFSDGVAAFEELAPHRPFASVPYALNAGISAGSITKSMLSVGVQADLNRTITKTMLAQEVLTDLNRTIDKSMLAQEVLTDLNRTIDKSMLAQEVLTDLNATPQAGSITQQMLASDVQAMLSGQSSSIFAPTLANPYGYAGGTPIEHDYSSYTVPNDKVLVILTSAYWYGNVNANGQKVRESLSGISIFPSGTVVTTSGGNSATRNGWSGLLFDPLPHISPVIVPIGYQVPSDQVLVLTSGTGADSGGTLGGSFSRDFASSMPTIHHSGSILNAGGTGYLVDASMLVNSGGSGGGSGSSNAVNLSSDLNVTNETHIFADKDLNRTVVVRLPKASDHNLKSVQIVPNPGQVIRVEGDDGELYGADWANLSQPIELISNQGRWNPLGYQLQLAIRGMVFDVWSGSQNGQPQNFTDVNGTIYFVAENGVDGIELWKTDGTAAGTSQVKDFNSGSGHGLGHYDMFGNITANTLCRLGNSLLFKANDGVTGDGLWKTDGTESGTVLVKNSGFSFLSLSESIVFQGNLLFLANDGSLGLWKTDGTESGTVKLASFSGGYGVSDFIVFNNEVFFKGGQSSYGYELWKTDGTTSGTVMVKDIRGGSSSGLSYGFTELAGSLYFAATDGSNNSELWKTDGTSGGTMMVKDIKSGGSSNPQNFITYSNSIFFNADDGINGRALWKTDGTSGGTVMIKNMLSFDVESVVCGGNLFFTSDDGVHGNELWKTDGTTSGTVLVKDIYPGSNGSGPRYLVAMGSNLLFAAADSENGTELWISDGTADGTRLFRDIRPGPTHSSPEHLQNIGGDLYLSAEDVNGRELWKFDASEF